MTNRHTVYFDHKKIVFLPKSHEAVDSQAIQIMDSVNREQFIAFTKDKKCLLHCLCDDPAQSFRSFRGYFKLLKAAGGLVANDRGQWLFIYRNNRWDLPKGLVEAGEKTTDSAIREVSEECGINAIEIIKPLPVTYHVYPIEHSQWVLKETCWYLMRALKTEALRPQTAEGITRAAWRNPNDLEEIRENTYGSIRELIDLCL